MFAGFLDEEMGESRRAVALPRGHDRVLSFVGLHSSQSSRTCRCIRCSNSPELMAPRIRYR